MGKRVTFEDHPTAKDWITIVGVVGDVKDKPSSPGAGTRFLVGIVAAKQQLLAGFFGRSVTGESKTARELYPGTGKAA